MNDDIANKLYKLALKAYKHNEVPVSAVIVKNNKIISYAYNKRKNTNNPIAHAEIIAIIKACKKLKDWRLSDCEMYVTLLPCHMCLEVIKEVRISKLYYYCDNIKTINSNLFCNKIENDYSKLFSELLTTFFKKLR